MEPTADSNIHEYLQSGQYYHNVHLMIHGYLFDQQHDFLFEVSVKGKDIDIYVAAAVYDWVHENSNSLSYHQKILVMVRTTRTGTTVQFCDDGKIGPDIKITTFGELRARLLPKLEKYIAAQKIVGISKAHLCVHVFKLEQRLAALEQELATLKEHASRNAPMSPC